MNVGGSRSEGALPQELVDLYQQLFEETSGLRQNLVGQMMGWITGEGVHEYAQVGGTPGSWQQRYVPGQPASGDPHAGEGEATPYQPATPPTYETVWVEGTGGEMKWIPTGEGGVQIPMIAQAQEAQRLATSQAISGTEESMAKSGLSGTPFAEMILGQTRQKGTQAVQGVEGAFSQLMMQLIPGFVTGQTSSVMGALPGTRETDAKQGQFGFGGG